MAHNQTMSIEEENWSWIKSNSEATGTKISTFLNQVIRSARGEITLLNPTGPSNNLKAVVDETIQETKTINEESTTSINERKQKFFEHCLRKKKELGDQFSVSAFAPAVARTMFGLEDVQPFELEEYLEENEC